MDSSRPKGDSKKLGDSRRCRCRDEPGRAVCLRESRLRLLDEGSIDVMLLRRGNGPDEPRGVGAGHRSLELLLRRRRRALRL